jgi:hypothetical protein
MSKAYLGNKGLTPGTNEPASTERFELLREIVPSSPLTSEIIFRADRDHIDRIELGEFDGVRFPIPDKNSHKTRFSW